MTSCIDSDDKQYTRVDKRTTPDILSAFNDAGCTHGRLAFKLTEGAHSH